MNITTESLTSQQRKAIYLCVGLIVASYLVHSITQSIQMARYRERVIAAHKLREAQAMAAAQAKAAKAAKDAAEKEKATNTSFSLQTTTPIQPQALAPMPADPGLASLMGAWSGTTAMPGRGLCSVALRLTYSADGTVTGAPALVFSNAYHLANTGRIPSTTAQDMYNPESAVIKGTPDKDVIQFALHADLGHSTEGCSIKSATLTVFGDAIDFAWQENNPNLHEHRCTGGRAILHRGRR